MSDDNNSCQSDTMLLEDKLLNYCESDTISEEGIHEIIDRHKESTPDNYLHDEPNREPHQSKVE